LVITASDSQFEIPYTGRPAREAVAYSRQEL
jgi:hypothetical protein